MYMLTTVTLEIIAREGKRTRVRIVDADGVNEKELRVDDSVTVTVENVLRQIPDDAAEIVKAAMAARYALHGEQLSLNLTD